MSETGNKTALPYFAKRVPVDIEFNNLTYCVPEGGCKGNKTILTSISGKFRCGEMTAIMGPSGAGKSSLMNILAGFTSLNTTGEVLVNGAERDLRAFRKMSCYIMQQDELCPHLTVQEAMMCSANLKLGDSITNSQKQLVVDEILETIGLKDSKKTRTLNLSGGQRKRLAIALELVNNPPIMFLDEPTSGLDSSSCIQAIMLLKRLAQGGRTIICTIHQPSARVFEMFDRLYLLANGQCIYRGLTSGLVHFLSHAGFECPSYHNPADYVMDVAHEHSEEIVPMLVSAVQNGRCDILNTEPYRAPSSPLAATAKTSESGGNLKTDDTAIPIDGSASADALPKPICSSQNTDENLQLKSRRASGWSQFLILLRRTLICILRNQILTATRITSHLAVGLLIGMLYYGIGNEASKAFNNAGALFFNLLFLMFTSMMPTVLTFPLEMAILKREHLNNWYSLKSYYLAKTVADLPFQFTFPTIYLILVYFMSGQPYDAFRFFMLLGMYVMTSLVAQSLGLVIGAATEIQTAVYLGPTSTVPIILFSGFFITFNKMPSYLRWFSYVAYVRYGFEGTLQAVYGFNRPDMNCSEAFCPYQSPVKFLEEFDVQDSMYWVDLAALTAIFLVLRLAAYIILRLKLRFNQ